MKKRKLSVRPVSDLTPRDDAPIDAATVTMLADSIPAEGLREPLVITADGHVLHGNHRLAAAIEAGIEELECVIEPAVRGDGGFDVREAQVLAENLVRYVAPRGERSRGLARMVALRAGGLSQSDSKTPNQAKTLEKSPEKQVEKPTAGRPKSKVRDAIKSVAEQQKVHENTVANAVKEHAPELLAKRAAPKKPAVDKPQMTAERARIWRTFERSFGAAEKALGKAKRALAAVAKLDLGGGQQWQEAMRLREDIGVLHHRVAEYIPRGLCVWCGGVDPAKVAACPTCRGAGVVGKKLLQKGKAAAS